MLEQQGARLAESAPATFPDGGPALESWSAEQAAEEGLPPHKVPSAVRAAYIRSVCWSVSMDEVICKL